MKLICANCKTIIYVECPHCGRHLQKMNLNGHDVWLCEAPLSTISFFAIEHMETARGLCPDCLQLHNQTLRELKAELDGNRANLQLQVRKGVE